MNSIKSVLQSFINFIVRSSRRKLMMEQIRFLLFELRKLNENLREQAFTAGNGLSDQEIQTTASFDYQWLEFNTGKALSDDERFMTEIKDTICKITDIPADWFSDRNVLDLGCGSGRFTYGLLSLGSRVTASDQSRAGLEQTKRLCERFSERLCLRHDNLLMWDDEADFDLVFCYGVVHHTGNTYLAIRNAARKVKQPEGKLFLMAYGFPETLDDFAEINRYESLRQELRNLDFNSKREILLERFGPTLAHGWFDAVSPRINDLLTYTEIEALLLKLRFKNIKRTLVNRNHHIIAECR